jgi:hypothetical protein
LGSVRYSVAPAPPQPGSQIHRTSGDPTRLMSPRGVRQRVGQCPVRRS